MYTQCMDELEISGKRFISSKRAAKENRYHVDYIGQLIRGGKIVGTKVGRAWYVDENSLAAYLGKEAAIASTNANTARIFSEAPTEVRVQRDAILQGQASEEKPLLRKEETPLPTTRLTYLSDDEPFKPITHYREELEEASWEEEVEAAPRIVQAPQKGTKKSRVLLLAIVGGIVFAAAVGSSYLVSYVDTVAGTQNSASLGLTQIIREK